MPMITKLNFNDALKPAMELAFGKTLICRDLDVAAQYAKSENLDCITLEGTVHRNSNLVVKFINTSNVLIF